MDVLNRLNGRRSRSTVRSPPGGRRRIWLTSVSRRIVLRCRQWFPGGRHDPIRERSRNGDRSAGRGRLFKRGSGSVRIPRALQPHAERRKSGRLDFGDGPKAIRARRADLDHATRDRPSGALHFKGSHRLIRRSISGAEADPDPRRPQLLSNGPVGTGPAPLHAVARRGLRARSLAVDRSFE